METGVQASTHAQQISTQSEAYSRNNPEQELATKPAKKAHAIPTSPSCPRPTTGDFGEHDPEGVNVNSTFSIPDGLRADGRRTPAH